MSSRIAVLLMYLHKILLPIQMCLVFLVYISNSVMLGLRPTSSVRAWLPYGARREESFVFDDKTRLVDRVRLSKSERGRPGSSSWYSVKGNGFIPHMLPVSQDSTLNH
ncbi:uncharacterized protein ACIGJ3_004543 isoform 1-T1 [Trichechus inunguis]